MLKKITSAGSREDGKLPTRAMDTVETRDDALLLAQTQDLARR